MKIDKEGLEMLKEIMALDFSILDLCLFLDTHPMEQKALALHNEYVLKVGKLKEKYQEKYALLTQEHLSSCPWEWIESPWPWEINYDMGGRS